LTVGRTSWRDGLAISLWVRLLLFLILILDFLLLLFLVVRAQNLNGFVSCVGSSGLR
jgi:hypothetical protein